MPCINIWFALRPEYLVCRAVQSPALHCLVPLVSIMIIMLRIIQLFASLFVFVAACVSSAMAQERYAEVQIDTPNGWNMVQMQTFSGSVPSRAWVFRRTETEVETLVSVMMTEGIIDGLPQQSLANLMRLYLQSLIVGWGGTAEGIDEKDQENMGILCGDGAGYQMKAKFGAREYRYVGCMLRTREWSRIVTVVSWMPEGSSETDMRNRLMLFTQAVVLPPPAFDEDVE